MSYLPESGLPPTDRHRLVLAACVALASVVSSLPVFAVEDFSQGGAAGECSVANYLMQWSLVPLIVIFTAEAGSEGHDDSLARTVRNGKETIIGTALASLNLEVLDRLLTLLGAPEGGACAASSGDECSRRWWSYGGDWMGPPFLAFFFLVYFLEKVLYAPLGPNSKMFALSSHVYIMMAYLNPRTELFVTHFLCRLHVVVVVLTVLGVAMATLAVLASRLDACCAGRMPAWHFMGDAATERSEQWRQLRSWRYWVPFSCLAGPRRQHGPGSRGRPWRRSLNFVSVLIACGLGWTGALRPVVDIYDYKMANTATLMIRDNYKHDAVFKQLVDRGLGRFQGVAAGGIAGNVLLTLLYKAPPLLLAVSFAWQCAMVYVYYSQSQYSYIGVLTASFCAMATMPPAGLDTWAKQMHSAEGIGWALGNPYRRLIAEFLGISLMSLVESAFFFYPCGMGGSRPAPGAAAASGRDADCPLNPEVSLVETPPGAPPAGPPAGPPAASPAGSPADPPDSLH